MIRVGQATITPVFEVDAGEIIEQTLPDAKPEVVQQITWLKPSYMTDEGRLKAQVQSFLVEVGGLKIVVDTACGDGRDRPDLPAWGNMQTGFMDRFNKVWSPKDVNIVLNTHMHFDHVGWNTTSVDGKWVPTFPNAQYIFSEAEFNYWKTQPEKELGDDCKGFRESVLPIYEAGLAKLVPDDYKVSDQVSFLPTPGHTPGHVCILIESDGHQAVIVGDLLHHPCQIARPEWGTPFDSDGPKATNSRRQVLERFADTEALLIGAHFAQPVGGKIKRDGPGFRLT